MSIQISSNSNLMSSFSAMSVANSQNSTNSMSGNNSSSTAVSSISATASNSSPTTSSHSATASKSSSTAASKAQMNQNNEIGLAKQLLQQGKSVNDVETQTGLSAAQVQQLQEETPTTYSPSSSQQSQ